MYSMEIKTPPIPTCILVKKHVDLPYVWPGYWLQTSSTSSIACSWSFSARAR